MLDVFKSLLKSKLVKKNRTTITITIHVDGGNIVVEDEAQKDNGEPLNESSKIKENVTEINQLSDDEFKRLIGYEETERTN